MDVIGVEVQRLYVRRYGVTSEDRSHPRPLRTHSAGGAALLMRWRYRRRLALGGAISELLMVTLYSVAWSRSVSATVVFWALDLPQILCSIFMIRFLMLDLVREELRDAERDPQTEEVPPPTEAEKDAP